jgi:hypothetical protein
MSDAVTPGAGLVLQFVPRPVVVRIEIGAPTRVPDGHNASRVAVPIPNRNRLAIAFAR